MDPLPTYNIRGLCYVLTALATGIVFGDTAERCSDNDCPSRMAAVLGLAVVAFVFCLPPFLMTLFHVRCKSWIEAMLATVLIGLTTAAVGVVSSIETLRRYPFLRRLPLGFSWVAEMFALIAWYLIVVDVIDSGEEKEGKDVDKGAAVEGGVDTVAPVIE